MNKIVLDKEITLNNFVGDINLDEIDNILSIDGHCIINNITNKVNNLKIYLKENASLIMNSVSSDVSGKMKIEINHEANSTLKFNEAIVCNDKFNLDINTLIKSNDIKSEFFLRIINKSDEDILVNATGNINNDTHNNILTEDLRGLLTSDNKITILPNLLVNSNDVIANHNVTISNVNNEEKFYLKAKGLNDNLATKLLTEGFILSIFEDNDFKEKIKNNL